MSVGVQRQRGRRLWVQLQHLQLPARDGHEVHAAQASQVEALGGGAPCRRPRSRPARAACPRRAVAAAAARPTASASCVPEPKPARAGSTCSSRRCGGARRPLWARRLRRCAKARGSSAAAPGGVGRGAVAGCGPQRDHRLEAVDHQPQAAVRSPERGRWVEKAQVQPTRRAQGATAHGGHGAGEAGADRSIASSVGIGQVWTGSHGPLVGPAGMPEAGERQAAFRERLSQLAPCTAWLRAGRRCCNLRTVCPVPRCAPVRTGTRCATRSLESCHR